MSAGTVLVGNNAAFGAGTVTFSGGKISSDGATGRTLANALGLSGSLALGDGTNNGALTFSGAAALSAATMLEVASGHDADGGEWGDAERDCEWSV